MLRLLLKRFNPRICKRCDWTHVRFSDRTFCFNPRICKRCDSLISLSWYPPSCFNPRICKRCDVYHIFCIHNPQVSIHASVKDATYSYCNRKVGYGFNPRICKRCDYRIARVIADVLGFNPRICKRCDQYDKPHKS